MEIYSEALAKMFAAENIAIEIKNSPTAYFDIEKRRMTFPKWILQLPVASRELLMLHEASHALHTPKIGTHEAAKDYEQVFRSIINILEDKRIEDLMKQKFPGSKATFTRGFFELVNTNLFGIHFDEDMSEMNLLDRMNLHFKGDYYFEPEFTEEEQYWVDRAANNKTFDEVYQNAIELYEYLKEEYSKEVLENIKWELGEVSDDETGTQSFTMDELEELLSEEDFQKLQKALKEGNSQQTKEIIRDTLEENNLDFAEENTSRTEQAWEKNQERMQRRNNESSSREIINTCFARKLNANDFIVSNDTITDIIQSDMSHIGSNAKIQFENFIRDHKQEMSPILSHMVREFYRKKAAEDFRRTQQSKTGNLDLKKLSRYKFDSDLFLNKSIVKDEKNHGFVLLLDWSVSMSYIMTNAILQLVNNVMFCKAINVPFVAYAFSSEAAKTHDSPMQIVYHATEDCDMRIGADLKLLELFDSTKSNYDQQLRNLFYLAFSFHTDRRTNRQEFQSFEKRLNSMNEDPFKKEYEIKWAKERKNEMFVLSDMFDLGGTPLNDSLLLMNYILPKKQREMNVNILNLVVITDGDSNYSDRVAGELETEMKPYTPETIESHLPEEKRPKEREYLRECNMKVRTSDRFKERISSETNSTYIRSLHSNKVYNLNKPTQYDVFTAHNNGRKITRNIANIIKQDTNANVICIELMTTSSAAFRRNLVPWFGIYDENEIDTYATDYRKNGFCVIPNLGYDQIFVVDLNKVGNQKYNDNYYRSSMSCGEIDHFEDLEAKDDGKGLTTRQLKTALNKNQSLKNNRKFMASRLVDIMSEYQSVVEKKKKIELALDIAPEE